ncbi:terminase TerL endonuclease subunit [Lactobacillus paragasseri]|uniref:terminase TerL endonuclease subunit n=1 Tax=Lactobacillus paragasseri TaxID=2107999 RepID=UPI0029C2CEA0|nr:terminase TerL endonuclease subunit [Lactobacillus paragasseri]MDX5123167.1 terminase TerL endonuclease subunit [Lactobacillus paragasseri]MDX5128868.1 terminase TerL endonuclease subunit [Lactobacillus paragasseri]MDX5132372.1 terminase TerL endonuclease subunit [Lactobacillus paragasseri]MDX5136322.1 terminase TerL endonuclease subunit [Lactobacillus paragasseri]MDX5140002.1 terminase TerL endonuclease subunit [Lactobacillus paragasseri]
MKIDLTQTHDVIGAYKSIDWSDIKAKYHDPATLYAFSVLNCEKTTGYMEKLHAFRHLMDLTRQNTKDFLYHYDVEEANKALTIASVIPDVDTHKIMPLMDWQKFILCQINGWKDENNERRFTDIHISVGRGQGKTQIAAVQLCKAFLVDTLGYTNKDFLVTANTSDQSNKLFGYVKKMMKTVISIEPFKTLAKKTQLEIQANQIIQKKTNNKIWKISYEADKYDSTHNVLAIYDEAGALKSFDRLTDIPDGQSQVIPYHQFIKISSAYPDPTSPFHDEQIKMQNIMEKDFERKGDNSLCLVWMQDDLDETYKPETWVKSNPLIALSDKERERRTGNLIKQRDQAILNNTLHKFKNKNLNLWLKQSIASYLNLKDVEDAVDNDFKIDGREVFIGFDYSMFSDNTAIGFVYPYGDGQFRLEQHSFIPWQHAGNIETKENQDGIVYRQYPEYCTITAHPQGIINPEQIYRWLLNYVEQHQLKVKFFGYDRFGSYQVKNITESLNVNTDWYIMDIQQRTSALANPTKFLQELFVTHKVSIPNDPVMQKALLNAVVKADKIGIQVDKDKATLKIDVVDALIDALFQGMYYFDENSDLNNKDTEIDRMTEQQVLDWFKNPNSGLLGGEHSGH